MKKGTCFATGVAAGVAGATLVGMVLTGAVSFNKPKITNDNEDLDWGDFNNTVFDDEDTVTLHSVDPEEDTEDEAGTESSENTED